jgi:hypothetical protein
MPASQETLCCYVAFLARSLSPSSIASYLNIIRILHLDAGLENPLADNWELQMVHRGVSRLKGSLLNRNFLSLLLFFVNFSPCLITLTPH